MELISKNTAKAFRKSMKSKWRKNNNSSSLSSSSSSLSNVIGRCFEPYGCFRITEPFRTIYRPINLIPEPPSAIKISFYLRTRSNPTLPERLSYTETTEYLVSKYFRPEFELKLIVHGYLESSDEYWVNEMSVALLNRADVNVICVDWMLGASPPYSQAVANTRLVGAMIAHLIKIIQNSFPARFPGKNIHIIGHSLGAHIAGYTGQIIPDLGQITGLDPAEPYFQHTDPLVRLDPNDARFVDVIHSDVSSIMSGGFGMSQTCGHIDFYPNGGIDQPGCKQHSIKNVMDYISKEKNIFDGIRRFIGCNHARSFLIYIEAINSECPFLAFPCHSYDEFISGQCGSTLSCGSNEMKQQQRPMSKILMNNNSNGTTTTATSAITFPIRLGLDSKLDYKLAEEKRLELANNNNNRIHVPLGQNEHGGGHVSKMAYFLQTNDKSPYCHYHYNVKLVFHSNNSNNRNFRKMTFHQQQQQQQHHHHWHLNRRSRTSTTTATASGTATTNSNGNGAGPGTGSSDPSIQQQQSFDWPFNGKLLLTAVGSRNRITTETIIKQENFRETTTGTGKINEENLIEYNMLISGGDLGKILRIELDWRRHQHTAPILPRSLVASLNPTSKTTFKKSINHWSSVNNIVNEILPMKSLITEPAEFFHHQFTGTTSVNGNIVFRAVIIRKLENNKQTIFCVKEKDTQEMFLWRQISKSPGKSIITLLSTTTNTDPVTSIDESSLSTTQPPTTTAATSSSSASASSSSSSSAIPITTNSIVSNFCS